MMSVGQRAHTKTSDSGANFSDLTWQVLGLLLCTATILLASLLRFRYQLQLQPALRQISKNY